ncbi:MAG TPA: efflux RND transporter periplasmic adaptor subunit [Gammaproteobacteria bacterium]|nr:efflux RND transporter periplasmic adaptor subunit [Gammaproteobacteria bacterium]
MKARVGIGLLLAAAAAGALYWWLTNNHAPVDESQLLLYGNVDIREVRLAFNGSEHVAEILVDEGDRVTAGQLVARLHTELLQAAVDRARADVAAVEAEAHVAQLSYQRIRQMADRKLVSKAEVDEAEGKKLAAKARVVAAEAALAESVQTLSDAELYAPETGVIRERIVEEGDFVTPQTPVLTMALLNPVWVRTYLPESYLGRVTPGAVAHITTDSFVGKEYEGWVGSISPTAEFTPKNIETPDLRTRLVYQVRIIACNPEQELRLGMPATVEIALDQEQSTADDPQQRCSKAGSDP